MGSANVVPASRISGPNFGPARRAHFWDLVTRWHLKRGPESGPDFGPIFSPGNRLFGHSVCASNGDVAVEFVPAQSVPDLQALRLCQHGRDVYPHVSCFSSVGLGRSHGQLSVQGQHVIMIWLRYIEKYGRYRTLLWS